jgi:hypothetical protein
VPESSGHRLIGEHIDRFVRIEADLRKQAEAISQLLEWQDRMNEDMYNGGKEGIKTKLTRFEAEYTATERTRKEDHQENRAKLNLIIALLALAVALFGALITYEVKHEHSLLHSHPLHTDNSPAYADAEKR